MGEGERALEGKVAIVTGAGRGIGKAIAVAYAEAGAAVCCAARTLAEIRETVREIEGAGGRGLAIQTDVTQRDAVQRMVEATAAHYGGLDILVIDAGINADRRRVEESNPDDWRATLEVNLFGAYHCARAAIPHMKARGAGKIITIGSGLGHRARAGASAYACSKAGLWMLTRVLAVELAEYRISVNELIPGPVVTPMTAQLQNAKDSVFQIGSEWVKTPQDVVPLALFLAAQPDVGPTAQSYSLMRREK